MLLPHINEQKIHLCLNPNPGFVLFCFVDFNPTRVHQDGTAIR